MGTLGRLVRIFLAETDEGFLFIIFGRKFLQFCSEVLSRLRKVFMYSERRLFVCICLLVGSCEVWVLFEECVLLWDIFLFVVFVRVLWDVVEVVHPGELLGDEILECFGHGFWFGGS